MTESLRRTSLYDAHVAAGARLVPFAGWEMPVQYAGVKEEHIAVRSAAGVFDVSHMGEIRTHGPDAEAFLQRLLSNDVSRIALHGAQYALLLRPDGGVVDDLFTYRMADGVFLTVTNAANHEKDLAWFREHADGFDVVIEDAAADYAMLAVQGPKARERIAPLVDGELPERFRIERRRLRVGGDAAVDALIAGTGYTGEDGVEVLLAPEAAPALWDALLEAGVTPVGLGARDTLRLESCFHLYGNDLSDDRDPIGAGLGWAVKEDTGHLGAEATRAAREQLAADGGTGPDRQRLVPFRFTDRGIPRGGNAVVGGGVVTSGGFSPSLEAGVGLAYVPGAKAAPGTALEIDVRGKVRPAVVTGKPLFPPQG